MVPSICSKTLPETLLPCAATPLTIGEALVIEFTAPMIWFATPMIFYGASMTLVGTSMMFSSLKNIIEVVFDRFGML